MQINGKTKRGKRAGRAVRAALIGREPDLRPSGLKSAYPVTPNTGSRSATAAVADAAKYCEGAFIEEYPETHVIPRRSITAASCLRQFPAQVETEPVHSRQLDKVSGLMVETTDNRVTWKSDKTLLRASNPFAGEKGYKREGGIRQGANTRKFTEYVAENPLVDQVLGPAIDEDMGD